MDTEYQLTAERILPKPHDFSKYTGTLKNMMKRLKGENDDPLDVAPASIQYSRGLTNPTGENNCFVNSAVQALWHMDVFRKNFKSVDGHACMGDACIFCALKVLFTQFVYSDKESLPPDALRKALAISFMKEKRFQLRSMDDAAECFENILLQIHYCLTDNMEDSQCNVGHCIPHNKFAMTVLKQSECECGATSEPFLYKEFVRYISSVQLCTEIKNLENWRHTASFGKVLSNASAEKRDCPSKCGKTAEVKDDLVNCPDVVTIGINWDCDPSHHHISEVITGIKLSLRVKDMYYRVFESQAEEGVFELGGLIAYYGKHYCTFFYHSSHKQWLYLEDTTVRPLGPSWNKVVDICVKSHYQPSLLFYCNPKWTRIDTSNAPSETNLLPGYTITCKSPGVDNHSGGSADYWPVKKIPEYQGNPESPPSNSWTPIYHKKDVVEIGQAALGLVEEPDVTPPSSLKQSQSSLDRQNNNQQNSPKASSMDEKHKVNGNVASKEQSWVHDKNTAPVTTNTLPKNLVATKNQVDAKSNNAKSYSIGNSHFYTQTPQDRTPAQDRSDGMDADGWEQLYEKQKDSRNDRATQNTTRPAARSALNIRPIDTFDMSVFDDAVKISEKTAEEEVKGQSETDGRERKLKSFSSLDGQYEECGDGFLVHHNNAYIDAYDTHDSFVIVPTDTSTLPARGSSLKSGNNRSLATHNNTGSRNSSRDRNFAPQYSSRGYGTLPQTRSEPLKHSVSFSHGRPSIPQESISPAGGEMSYMEDSWEDLATNLFASGGQGPRPGASIRKPNRNEIKTTEVKRTMSLEPQARRPEWSGKTEIGALWKQAKELIERSSDAELDGDNAVALGHSTQAAYKLKKLLGNSSLSSEQRIPIRKMYNKTKDTTLYLEGKLNDENSLKSYSRSSSSGIEDDFHDIERKRRQPFLQDAVDDVKRSLPSNGATPVQHIPVTCWNGNSSATRGPTVINVPIIIEGSHGNRGYQGYSNTVNRPHMKPVLEVPVRVSSTLPRKHVPASRQFFVTASDSQGR